MNRIFIEHVLSVLRNSTQSVVNILQQVFFFGRKNKQGRCTERDSLQWPDGFFSTLRELGQVILL